MNRLRSAARLHLPPAAQWRRVPRCPNLPLPAQRGEVSRSVSPRLDRGDGGGLAAFCALVTAAILLFAACAADNPGPDPTPPEPQQTREGPEQREQDGTRQQPQQQESPQPSAAQAERQPGQTQQEESQEQAPDDSEQPQVIEQQTPQSLALQPILGGYQFQQPIEMLSLPDGSLLIAEQRGYITRFVEDNGEIEQFGILDLTDSVRFGGEQGLLSIALHPDLEREPYLYVYYSPRDADVTRLSRFRLVLGAALTASELVIIEVPQPYSNHNGGAVRFGPDGMLYLGYGDGGAANDPQGHGQNRQTLLGAIIRIDVNEINTSTPYRIPTDNPFLGIAGVRPEIWAYGLRNPWRMAFDPETGLLWVGDVGQNRVEEIAIVGPGENHGWNIFEGNECFGSDDECATLGDAVAPVGTYGHNEGCSVTGGMVYRGNALPHLVGAYVFGDYCSGTIWALRSHDAAETGWTRDIILQTDHPIASFAVDNDDEIHVLTFNGPILRLIPEER